MGSKYKKKNIMKKIPENIKQTINVLLKPYNINFIALVKEKEEEKKAIDLKIIRDDFLSIHDAMRMSTLSRCTITRAAERGDIRICKTNPARCGRLLIYKDDFYNWLSSREKTY